MEVLMISEGLAAGIVFAMAVVAAYVSYLRRNVAKPISAHGEVVLCVLSDLEQEVEIDVIRERTRDAFDGRYLYSCLLTLRQKGLVDQRKIKLEAIGGKSARTRNFYRLSSKGKEVTRLLLQKRVGQ